jgi:PAS domain S-box-containing protein
LVDREDVDHTRRSEAVEPVDSSEHLDTLVRELRQTQHAAEVAEARLSAVVEMAPDAILLIDPQGQITLVNHRTEALFGYRRDDLLGQSIELLVPELLRKIHRRHRAKYLSDPRLRPMGARQELFGRRADGTQFPVEVNLGPIPVDGVTHSLAICRDVTEQRRLEQELAARAQEIESIFEADADAVMLFDPQGRTLRMNTAQRHLLGYDVTGQSDYVSPEDRVQGYAVSDAAGRPLPQEQWPIYRVLRGETLTGPQAVELRMLTLDGREIQVSVSGSPVVNGEGQIIGGVTSARDVTSERQLEQQRMDILRVVVHDLASPVAALKMYLQLQKRSLDRGQPRPPNPELVTTLTQSIARMQRLLDDMRMVVGVEGHQMSLDLHPVDLVALCQQEAQSIQLATKRTVRVELPAGPVMIDADQDRIGQVLANLLSNADKYSPLDRTITLTLRVEPGQSSQFIEAGGEQTPRDRGAMRARQARVLIRDEGPGIPLQEQPHLWERFHRVAGVQARPGTGESLGFGLYIGQEIIKAHKGVIGVESVAGRGSTFWFTLPLLTP